MTWAAIAGAAIARAIKVAANTTMIFLVIHPLLMGLLGLTTKPPGRVDEIQLQKVVGMSVARSSG